MRRSNFALPTLVFHSVRKGAGKDLYALEPTHFDAIVAMITEKFGGSVSMEDIITNQGNLINQRRVLLTFDDGYEDHSEVVLPILRKYKAKATFFLLPKYFGRKNLWDHRSQVILKHLSIEQTKKLIKDGHTVGSHGLTHNSLLKFNDQQLKNELQESKDILENDLQIDVNCFSYPYGDFDQKITKLSSSIYKYSFATNKETSPDWNQFGYTQIKRERILSNMSLKEIEALINEYK
ncbi:MAG TPA: polysaccharide deacetylase family protein [Patescibacteria group bacterium]|nr:polysaccharide deacetylase family protein [Patescibacteria group bacterium]